MSWAGVPQPWLGRCWNRPTESWSPPGVLVNDDSCIATATAMTQPRGGTCICWPTATMMAALPTWMLLHWPTEGQPPAGAAGGLPGLASVRLGAGLAQAAMATPPAPMTAAPRQQVPMRSRTPVSRAMALAVMLGLPFVFLGSVPGTCRSLLCGCGHGAVCTRRTRRMPAPVLGCRLVRLVGRRVRLLGRARAAGVRPDPLAVRRLLVWRPVVP